MKPEVVIQTPKPKPYVEVPVPPRILKRTEELPKKEIPTEDVEMKDEFRPNAGKQKAVDTSTPMSATTQETPTSTGVKPKSKHVEFREPSEKGNYSGKPKRASPAFKFSSDVQESVDHDRLLDKVLDGPANCTLRDILSTFEMSKRMQVITKTQKIPLETNTGNPKRTSSATIEEIEDDDIPPTVYVRATTAQPPKNAKFPKLVISNAEVDSDDEEAGLSFEERAENFFQRQLEEEFRRECGMESAREFTSENTIQQAPTYLAMVTAKITVTINGSKPIEMLLDSGSELNIITQELQEGLGLPMDPSGANWTLRGVSGHPVHLVGVCRNVPVDVGGMGFHHHFFVTQDKIGEKGMIGGQPWLFNHAARIDYIVGKGLQLQVWKDGDRENPSVRVSIPIIQSQRNVYKTTAQQPREVSISAISLESNELDINQFALRNYGSREATWEPAKPSLIASQGLAPQIPRLGNSLIEAFNTPESDIDKFGPLESNIDYVNKYATLNEPIFEALRQTWITTNVSQPGESLMERIENIGRAKGYEDYEARLFAQSFTHDIMGAKYKPVAKKVIPVSTYDPDTVIPEYMPLEPKELPPLTTNPRKMEEIVFTERLTKERIEMIIGNIPNGFLRKAELELILDVIFEFENAFAFTHAERGTFNTKYYPEYTMRTVPHVPWQIKPIRLPKSREAEIMEMLEDQRQAGKYELSSSSYRSAVFAVEKKNGKLRLVHDLQPLNRVTIRDAGLPPRMEDIIENLKGRSYYFVADLKSGYDAVPLKDGSRDLTAFHAYDLGSMRLTSLPQGYTNSMIEFCRRTSHMLKSMKPEHADSFVDDLFGMGPPTRYEEKSIPENPNIRQFIYEGIQVFRRLVSLVEMAGVTISGEKLVAATPALTALGTVVSLLGGHVTHEITAKILKWPVCQSVSDVRGFLGTAGYVRKWIKNFAKIALPLTMLTRHSTEIFNWSTEANEAFERLKFLASTAPPLIKINFELALKIIRPEMRTSDLGLVTIAVDSSIIGAGWILSQITEKGELPVLFGSVTFKEHEGRYSQPKLELYGLYRALKAQRHMLYGIHFRIKVDARSLIEMVNKPDMMPSIPGNRWLAFIQLFDYEIVHVPAERHKGPDGLSRRRRTDDDSSDSDAEMEADESFKFARTKEHFLDLQDLTTECLNSEIHEISNAARIGITNYENESELSWRKVKTHLETPLGYVVHEGESELPKKEIEEPHEHYVAKNDTEDYWDQILAYLHLMRLPSDADEARRVKNHAKSYFLMEKMLWKRNGTRPPLQVVLHPDRRLNLTKQAHDESGHRGKDPTYKKLSDSYWWPNQYLYVANYCRTCHECQMRSSYRNKIPIEPTYVRTILREFAADVVHMPLGKRGLRYIVDMREKFSGWLEAKALRKASSKAIAEMIFEVMTRFGCFPKITVDNGSEFKGAVTLLADKYNIPIIPISPYNPSANGIVERGHGVYIESIWKILQGNTAKWPEILPLAIWADRVTAKRTGVVPIISYMDNNHFSHSILRIEVGIR
jgi:hypothetical protein